MAQQPSLPKGTRDFSSQVMDRRDYLMQIIKDAFRLFGFSSMETPAMENLSTLTGKYGEEGDRLIFKILNSGDYLQKVNDDILHKKNSVQLTPQIADKALRYDLTVPFARFVAQNRHTLTLPFKRYQIQPVWRADRPQKGRYREFYQCDADVVGSSSLLQEIELIQLYDHVFTRLGLATTILINNRKVLAGLAEVAAIDDLLVDFTISLDKLDKIGVTKVQEEMLLRGISQTAIDKLSPLFQMSGSSYEKIQALEPLLRTSSIGMQGLDELNFIFQILNDLGLESAKLSFEVTLARGLNYYTGSILEVLADNVSIGSVGGGGRYDDLTSIFGLSGISGVGISFGLDRIYLALEQLDLFPNLSTHRLQILLTNLGSSESRLALQHLKSLRQAGFNAELYPDQSKLKTQMTYAHKRGITYVLILGEDELKTGSLSLKNMQSGDQHLFSSLEDCLNYLHTNL